MRSSVEKNKQTLAVFVGLAMIEITPQNINVLLNTETFLEI